MMTKEDCTKYKYDIFLLITIIEDLSANFIDEIKACEKIEKLNLPLVFLEAAMQCVIDHEYHQVYLTLLKKKEQKYGFAQNDKERFKL